MKKIDFENVINNVSDKYVEEAASFVPKRKAGLRWVALAACIAIIVTSVPFAFILNKESDDTISQPQTTTTSTNQPTDPEKGLPDGFYYKDMETIQLGTSQLVFNTSFLTDGKNIYANLDEETRPYVFEYDPLTNKQKQEIIEDIANKAKNYHNNEEAKIDIENYIGSFSQATYSTTTNKHILQTTVRYVPNNSFSDVKSIALNINGIHQTYYEETKVGIDYILGEFNEDNVYKCIEPLKQYLSDVLGVHELSQNIDIRFRYLINEIKPNATYIEDMNIRDIIPYGFGARKIMYVTIKLDPEKNEGKTLLKLFFYSDSIEAYGTGIYYLSEIYTEHSIASENYVELIDEETALKWLLKGYCIGNVGQFDDGCRSCTTKHRIPDEDLIPQNLECSLIYIPEVVYTQDDKSVTYDMPFYAFTVPCEIEGQWRVAYVPATEITDLNDMLYERTKAECVYRDHLSPGQPKREDYTGKLGK